MVNRSFFQRMEFPGVRRLCGWRYGPAGCGRSAPAAAGQVPVDENGNPIVEGEEQPSLETIEDKAIAAVQQIQAAASEAEAAIMNAKSAPVQNQEPDLQEAQFSMGEYGDYYEDFDYADERTFSDSEDNTLVSWLANETSIR